MMVPLRNEIGARTPTIEAITQFLRYATRFSDRTQRQYRDFLYRFADFAPKNLENICPETIDRFLGSLKILNSSKNTMLIPIKSFFSYLEEYYDFKNVAAKVKKLPEQPAKQRVISESELVKILTVATEPFINFLANTGLRAQEFCDLIPNSITDQKYMTIIGKGKRRRIVPLNAIAISCIPAIFAKKYTRDKMYWYCIKISKLVQIPPFGPHALRHRWVTAMVRKGVSRTIVARIAGMSETILEKTYCHLLTPDFLGVTDCLV